MKSWFAENEVDKRSDVRLDHEEEIFLDWDIKECRAHNSISRIGPYSSSDEIRIPRGSGSDGDSDQK